MTLSFYFQPNCVFNFNVYLLGIVPTPESKPFHCLWLRILGMKEWLMSSSIRRAESLMSLHTVWPSLLSLLLCSRLGNNCSIVSLIPSCPAHSQPGIHQGCAGSPRVDFWLPIPSFEAISLSSALKIPGCWSDLILSSWVQYRLHALLRLQLAVLGRFLPGKEPEFSWACPLELPISQWSTVPCFSLKVSCPICSAQLYTKLFALGWQVQDQLLNYGQKQKSLIFVVSILHCLWETFTLNSLNSDILISSKHLSGCENISLQVQNTWLSLQSWWPWGDERNSY